MFMATLLRKPWHILSRIFQVFFTLYLLLKYGLYVGTVLSNISVATIQLASLKKEVKMSSKFLSIFFFVQKRDKCQNTRKEEVL